MSHQRESIGSYEKTSDGSLATDFINIRNTIARYCIALDSKDFDLLAHVFTEDVQAKFPFGDVLTSREAVAAALEKRSVVASCSFRASEFRLTQCVD